MIATNSIVVEYDLPQEPALVWRMLTEPVLLEKWLMRNDIAPVVGHRFNFHTQPQGDWDGTVWCEVLVVDPEKRLRYTWRNGDPNNTASGHTLDTVVTWTLTPDGSGTRLLLEHEGFRDQDRSAYEAMGEGWRTKVREWLIEELAAL